VPKALEVDSFEALASMFKGLAEPARLKVLLALTEKCQSVSAIVDLTGLSQPTVSRHLRALRAESFVRGQRVGPYVYY
jgi:DNA-binding transcriptional ArsR family regulator